MTEAGFDPWATKYDGWFKTPRGATVLALEKDLIMRLAECRPAETALDAGCGTGNFTLELLSQGLAVACLDASAKMLEIAKAKSARAGYRAEFHHGVMESMPFPDGCFDLVLCVSALELSPAPGKALGELWRVVRPGGRLVVAVLNEDSPWAAQRKKREGASVWEGQRFYTANEFVELLHRATDRPREAITWSGSVFFGPRPTEVELDDAWNLERAGRANNPEKAAMLAARVYKTGDTN